MIYIDKWGDGWKRIGSYYMIRIKDNNIGLWSKGEGLEPKVKTEDFNMSTLRGESK